MCQIKISGWEKIPKLPQNAIHLQVVAHHRIINPGIQGDLPISAKLPNIGVPTIMNWKPNHNFSRMPSSKALYHLKCSKPFLPIYLFWNRRLFCVSAMENFGHGKVAAITRVVAKVPEHTFGIMHRLFHIYFLRWTGHCVILNLRWAKMMKGTRHLDPLYPSDRKFMIFMPHLTDNWAVLWKFTESGG